MRNRNLIQVEHLCHHYEIEPSFFNLLQDYGIVEVIMVEDIAYLEEDNLSDFERILHLHYDLDINPEGIDTIIHMLGRIKDLQKEVRELRCRLGISAEWENSAAE
jgi:hypothetical protein